MIILIIITPPYISGLTMVFMQEDIGNYLYVTAQCTWSVYLNVIIKISKSSLASTFYKHEAFIQVLKSIQEWLSKFDYSNIKIITGKTELQRSVEKMLLCNILQREKTINATKIVAAVICVVINTTINIKEGGENVCL